MFQWIIRGAVLFVFVILVLVGLLIKKYRWSRVSKVLMTLLFIGLGIIFLALSLLNITWL